MATFNYVLLLVFSIVAASLGHTLPQKGGKCELLTVLKCDTSISSCVPLLLNSKVPEITLNQFCKNPPYTM